ncbi:hypothetical protein PP713_14180 [Mycobacterium sp. CSUR Q5927]|nr:hypothetical protein [Mycobacterium sp. CSUR Q5927]
MSADVITATGTALASIIGAGGVVWASQSGLRRRVDDLEKARDDLEDRVKAVETERDKFRTLFRAAVRHIRDWMSWGVAHAPGTPPPPLPAELLDEV